MEPAANMRRCLESDVWATSPRIGRPSPPSPGPPRLASASKKILRGTSSRVNPIALPAIAKPTTSSTTAQTRRYATSLKYSGPIVPPFDAQSTITDRKSSRFFGTTEATSERDRRTQSIGNQNAFAIRQRSFSLESFTDSEYVMATFCT